MKKLLFCLLPNLAGAAALELREDSVALRLAAQLEYLTVHGGMVAVAIGFLGNIGSADTTISYFLIDADPITEQTKLPNAKVCGKVILSYSFAA